MAVRKIVTPWDEQGDVLRRPARRVRAFDPELHRLLDDMAETMREAQGVGLAAPQVGVPLRVAVIEYPEDDQDPESPPRLYELINPEIVKAKGSEVGQEGCLSLPGFAADVARATYVVVEALDRHGKRQRLKAHGWLARVFQHEIDHLHGILMTDRAETVYRVQENDAGETELIPLERAPVQA